MADTTSVVAPLDGNSLYVEQRKTSGNSELGKDAFLNLLVAQMKYQDPLEPMSNTESIAQLAQFSALEQMSNVATSQQQASAYSLVGKYVVGNKYTESTGVTEQIAGVVDSVRISGSSTFLVIGDVEIPISGVTNVTDPNSSALGVINSNIATSQSLALIGKNVQAIITDAEGNITNFIEGTVDYVKIANGRTILMVNDLEIFAEEVLMVSDEKMLIGKEATGVTKDADGKDVNTTGPIQGIDIVDGKPYLVIGGKQFAINTISDVTEGLNLVGKYADTSDATGLITGMKLKNGEVYLAIDNVDVKLETVKTSLLSKTAGSSSDTDSDTGASTGTEDVGDADEDGSDEENNEGEPESETENEG